MPISLPTHTSSPGVPATPCPRRRRGDSTSGTTLVELLIVLAILATTAALAIPRAARFVDRTAVHAAIDAIASACALARGAAVMRGTFVTVTIDTAGAAVKVSAGADTLLARPLDFGGTVRLSASRARVVYDRIGLGYGASNTTVIARRGRAADTLYTSRLGRVRH